MTTSLSDPVYLQDQYEALRREALGADGLGRRGHGLALFIARGMTAWVEALSALVGRSRASSSIEEQSHATPMPVLPSSLRSELATVLADMVLVCSPEIIP